MKSDLIWRRFPVLDQGCVALVDYMGDDAAVANAARTSYGNDTRDQTAETRVTDEGLIRRLMRERHTSPFEQAELKFFVQCPMDAWRQWIRHRTANVCEYSTRYKPAIDATQQTPADAWRLQSTDSKQGSAGMLAEWPVNTEEIVEFPEGDSRNDYTGPGGYLSSQEIQLHSICQEIYQERLAMGVAREQARKDLPLSTYTQAYWKIDLWNLLHFLGLRMDSHAQLEIRQYATIIGEQIVKPLFPIVWQAFLDFRLNATGLSGPEARLLGFALLPRDPSYGILSKATCLDFWKGIIRSTFNQREFDEAVAKIASFGVRLF